MLFIEDGFSLEASNIFVFSPIAAIDALDTPEGEPIRPYLYAWAMHMTSSPQTCVLCDHTHAGEDLSDVAYGVCAITPIKGGIVSVGLSCICVHCSVEMPLIEQTSTKISEHYVIDLKKCVAQTREEAHALAHATLTHFTFYLSDPLQRDRSCPRPLTPP